MKKSAVAAAVGLALSVHYQGAHALPEGGQVTAGQGKIGEPANGSLTIRQDSSRLAIDWLRFGIGVGQSVQFEQPGASAIALNRVIGNEASHIYGSLSANGQVFLLNPNGVLFAPGAQVNVGGLVASSLGLSNEDFMAGRYVFSRLGKAGSVTNQGDITAGYVALLGPQVANEGVITARLGTVGLAAGEQITLKLSDTSLVGLTVDKGALDALAANKHLIRADGGTVILTAKATDAILRNVVNNDGIIEARTLSARDGAIRLESTGTGITSVNGALEAKEIVVTGDKVGLYQHAELTAPSGTILVGGNFQGKGPERNASATYVAPGATLNADAVGEGDGGRVIVWSDGITAFYGHLSARGGPLAGDGGFAEISGRESLIVKGSMDLTAAHGRPGSILFDPKNIFVDDAGPGVLGDVDLFTAGGSGNTVHIDADVITDITNTGADVTLRANHNITVNEAIITNNPAGDGGNIALLAGNSIAINANITTDNGNLTLVANETVANGVVDAQRDSGVAVIDTSGGAINAGNGTVFMMVRAGDDKTNFDSGEIMLGPINAAALNVTNAGLGFSSNIRQSGPLTIAGTSSFNAGTGLIDLGTGTNDFAGTVDLLSSGAGQPHQIWDGNDLALGIVSLGAGTLTIETGTNGGATGHVTQTGPMTAQHVTIFTFAPLNDIILDQANQIADTANPFRLTDFGGGGWRDLSLRNDTAGGGWGLNFNNSWPTIGRDLTIRSASPISQVGALTVAGTASFDAGAQFIELDNGLNDFQGPVHLASTGAVPHTIFDANSLQLGTVSFATFGASLTVETGTGGGATGHVTQTGPITAEFVNIFTFAPISNIVLDEANMITDTTNPFRLQNSGTGTWGDVSLRNEFGAGAWQLNHTNQWATIGGDLTVRSVNAIAQTNAITVLGDSTFNSDQNVVLDRVRNDFQGVVNVTSTGFGGNQITDRNNLALGTISINPGVDFLAQTGGAGNFGDPDTGNLTQTVPLGMTKLRVSTLSTSTSDIVLDLANMMTNTTEAFDLQNNNSGSWGNVSLRNDFGAGAYSLNFNSGWTTVTGNLTISTLTGITQGNPIRVGGAATFITENALIDLPLVANDFQGAVNLTSTFNNVGTHRVSDRSDLQLGTINIDPFTSLQLQTGGVSGNTGNLAQSVPLGTLASPMRQIRLQTLSDTTSDITLNLANFFTDTTEPYLLQNTGTGTWGNVSLRNDYGAGDFRVNNNNQWTTIGGNLDIRTVLGFDQVNAISVVGTSRFETASGNIQLTANNDFQGVVTLVGGTNVNVRQDNAIHDLKVAPRTAPQLQLVSAASGLDLSAGTYASSNGLLALTALSTIDLVTGPVTFSGTNGITINGNVAGPGALVMNQTNPANGITVNGSLGTFGSRLGGLTINESGSLGVQLGTATGFVNGDLDVTSPAFIVMGSLAVSGTSHFQTNNHIVQLEGNNDFVGEVTVLGGALTSINQNSVNPLRVAPLTSDRLRLQSQQSNVALRAGTYQAAFDTLQISALGGGSITLGAGTVTLDAASGLTLAGNVEGPGALVLNQHGPGASFSVTGTLGTSGARLASLTIDNASLTGVQLSGSGAFVTGDLDITSAADIRLGTSAVTGTSRFQAGNFPAVINGDNDFVGLVTLTGTNEVWIAQNSPNPLRVAPLSADFMFFDSQQSNVQLTAGTYEATAGNIRIDTSFGNSIALGAGTVTLDAQNGVQLNGSVTGPGALSIHQRSAGGLISVGGSLGTSAARLGGLTIDDQSTIGMPLGTTQAFVAGNVDITAAGPIQFGAMAVSGTSRFDFQPGVQAGVNIFDPGNDFGGVVTVVDGTFVFLAHSGLGPLRVAPLSAENMTILSWQSDIQLSAGTYQSTVGSLDIGVLGGDAITLSAGTVTLDGANGVSVSNGDVHGPGALVIQQRNASGYLLSESLGTPVSPLASLAIHNASTNNLSLGDVNATAVVTVETAGDLTLPLGTVVSSSGSDVVLAAAGNFVNNAGSGALAPAGRWLVYSTSPAGSTEGGLAGAGVRLYNRTFAADPPATIAAGNHLVYVAQPTLAVTANNQSRSYGDANPAFTLALSGLVSDDGYTDTASDALLTGTAATTATTASPVAGSPYAITQGTVASGAGYALSFTDGQLTVSPRPITVTADAGQTKVYGNVDPTLGFSITTGNLVGADTLSGALARAAGENVGAYATNQGTLANPNYGITFTGSSFGITQRPVGVTADAGQAKTYGSADPALTYSITSGSLVGGDTLSGALARSAGENVGAYAMNQGTLANANYGITFTGNSFGILAAPLTVTATDASRHAGQPNPPFSANYSGFVLGDTPASLAGALNYATPATALSAAGSYPVTPFGLTSTNYSIAFVDGVLTVTPAPVTPPSIVVVVEAGRAYLDTLSGIQGNRITAPLPVEYSDLLRIENGGMRLPEGLQP